MKRKEEHEEQQQRHEGTAPAEGTLPAKKPNVKSLLDNKSAISRLMSRLADKKAKLESQLKEQEEKKRKLQEQQGATIYVAKATGNTFVPPPMIVGLPGAQPAAATTAAGIIRTGQKSYYDSVREEQAKIEEENKRNPYWDPRLRLGNKAERSRRAFQFIEPGKYTKIAEKERKKIKRQELVDNGILGPDAAVAGGATATSLLAMGDNNNSNSSSSSKDSNADSNAVALGVRTVYSMLEDVPAVEWWDAPFLSGGATGYPAGLDEEASSASEPGGVPGVDLSGIDSKIEVPPKKRPPRLGGDGDGDGGELTLYLTKEERKKMRKRRRQERLKEKQEAILIGLQKPPPPKVKLSNMMRVLTSEAVLDPTAVERKVREEAALRKQHRDKMNEDRMLTKEQRREKKEQKLVADAERNGYFVAVFKLLPNGLADPARRFKVDANAQSLLLKGCGIINSRFNLVIVEGSQKAIGRFKKLMLRRIKWNKNAAPLVQRPDQGVKKEKEGDGGGGGDSNVKTERGDGEDNSGGDDDDEEEDENEENEGDGAGDSRYCKLLWEGAIVKPAFKSFTFEADHKTDQELRKFLQSKNADSYWDLASNFDEAKDTKI